MSKTNSVQERHCSELDGRHMPIIDNLNDIINQDEKNSVEHFVEDYRRHFGAKPDFVVRAPGRVNLIGDHIDYHKFAVLPMAISNSIFLGVSCEPKTGDHKQGRVRIVNRDSDTYEPFEGEHSILYGSQLEKSHKWYYYVLCGYVGTLLSELCDIEPQDVCNQTKDFTNSTNGTCDEPLEISVRSKLSDNLNLFVHSNLPAASGLSSSSALVCASAVATKLFVSTSRSEPTLPDGPQIDRQFMAAACAEYEHLIGTHGGGMDQAVIMTARENYAVHVQFEDLLKCDHMVLPDNVVWLVSHCGISYPKAATSAFNSRVLETKLTAALIAGSADIQTLNQVQGKIFAAISSNDPRAGDSSSSIHDELLRYTSGKDLRNDGCSPIELSIDEISSRLGLSRAELLEKFNTSEQFLSESGLDRQTKMARRSQHVFEEADRVRQFLAVCQTTRDIHQLGRLMTASHASLRDLFECSHPKLDELVEVSLEAGALGARMTGAGWGGCVVTLVEASKSQQVLESLQKVSKFTFQTRPQSGCTIYKI